MTENETIRPHFSRAIYERWITRAEKRPGFARPAQVERYKQAIEWYDRQEEIRTKLKSDDPSIAPAPQLGNTSKGGRNIERIHELN